MDLVAGRYNYYPDYRTDVIITDNHIEIKKSHSSLKDERLLLSQKYFAAIVRFAIENGFVNRNDLKGDSEFWYTQRE